MFANGFWGHKTIFCLMAGWSFAPFILFFEKYVFSDWQFIISLIVMIAIDTALGLAQAWKSKDISSRRFADVFKKILTYFTLLMATHVAATYKVHGEANTILVWIDGVIYAAIMVRELISVLENCGALGFVVPKYLLTRLQYFDENGKFKGDDTQVP